MALLEHPVHPTLERADWHPSELRRVVIRLADGEFVQVGTAPNRESAMTLARSIVREITAPSGEWTLIEKLAQLETIVSVDVLRT